MFLAAFFFWPLGHILALGLEWEVLSQLVSDDYYWKVLGFTVWQAALSTVLTLLPGLGGAYFFSHYHFWGKAFLRALVTVPFVLPTVVVAAAFQALLGPQGLVNELMMLITGRTQPLFQLQQSLLFILLAHIFYNLAIVIRLVGGFWAGLNPRLLEAGRALGASPASLFWRVTWPLLRPAVVGAVLLIFLFTFTSFGVILILGGPTFSTLETEIYRQYVTFLRPDIAAALSLLQMAFTFGLMTVYANWQRQHLLRLDLRPQQLNLTRPGSPIARIGLSLMAFGLLVFQGGPLLALLWRSFVDRDGKLTLAYYLALPTLERGSVTFIPPLLAIGNSIGYGLLTVVMAGGLGLATIWLLSRPGRWSKWLDPLFMLPLGTSAATLGFGYIATFANLRTSPVLVLIAHTLVAFPFVVRNLLPVAQAIKPNLREAAASLGASPGRVWCEIELPIMGRALLVASAFAFVISLGEFGATSFIARPNSGYLTMPIAITRFLGQPGDLNTGRAFAMSVILMLICLLGFITIERFRYEHIGEF